MRFQQFFVGLNPLKKMHGFTLIEMMVVVAIVGILSSVAYPSFMSQIRKSRRSDAAVATSEILQAQERWRANNQNYVTTTSLLTTTPPNGLGLISLTTSGGYYLLSVSTNSATGCTTGGCYTTTATAVSGKSQASDTGCTTLTVNVTNGNATKLPDACWSK